MTATGTQQNRPGMNWVDALLNLFWECEDVVLHPRDDLENGQPSHELPARVLRAYEAAEKARQAL